MNDLLHNANEAMLDIKIFHTTDDLAIKAECIHSLYDLNFEETADMLLITILREDPKDLLQTEMIYTYTETEKPNFIKRLIGLFRKNSK
ncbi:MAG: hypothetical protein WBA59_03650 [Moheibacter sp.]